MSRIQKKRQQGKTSTTLEGENDKEREREREIDPMQTPKKVVGDDKPDSDDEKEKERERDRERERRRGRDKDKDKEEKPSDTPSDTKSPLNISVDEKPPIRRPPRGEKDKTQSKPDQIDENVGEKNEIAENKQIEKDLEKGPLKILQPLRTDPLGTFKNRHKKLERLNAESIPEIHFIGKILFGEDIVLDHSEGATCRWKVESSPCWLHLGGELQGQSHVVYARQDLSNNSFRYPFDHPIDLHFAESGIPGWGTPRLCVQTYRLDVHGRRILGGYGFIHLPLSHGSHTMDISLWRPIGSQGEEIDSYLLGRTPALLTSDPIYETAWQDRERMMTTTAGKIVLELHVLTRYMYKHHVDPN